MPSPTAALRAGFEYVRRNPLSLLTAAREAARLRVVVPLELVRWGLSRIRSNKVGDFTVSAQDGALGIGLTATAMGNRVRIGARLHLDAVAIAADQLRVELRVHGLTVDALGSEGGGPLQALLSSGAIDLSRPGRLVDFLPKRPPMLVEAQDDRFVLDLMKLGSLAKNEKLRRLLGLLAPVVSIRDLETAGDDLLVGLRVRPKGLPGLLAALRG